MKLTLTFSLLLVTLIGFSQNFNEKELLTDIKEVTVFLEGAQIFEVGTTIVPNGNTVFKIKNLSPFIDEKSIQVKTNGDFVLLSVNQKLNYLNEIRKSNRVDSLTNLLESSLSVTSKEEARLDVLKEKQSILNENKKVGSQNSGVTIIQLKQTIDFYETEITKYKEEEIKVKKSIGQAKKDQAALMKQLKAENDRKTLPTSEIEIRVHCLKQTKSEFHLTYIVSNAGWYPKYDVRVHDVKSPLELTYKAEVFQNTGIDWKNVKLRFSNGNPNQSGVMPELKTWNLNFARNTVIEDIFGVNRSPVHNVKGKVVGEDGQPLPGVNVLVKGTTIGTVTDTDGSYGLTLPNGAAQLVFSFIGLMTEEIEIDKPEINVRLKSDVTQLQEVVVTGYGSSGDASDALSGRVSGVQVSRSKRKNETLITTIIENQTTVEIEVETPYSIKSNGEKLRVDLKKYEIEGIYEYYAIPKLDKDAFLIARIINWDQYNLLEGEANLYFEDAFVGSSILDAKSSQDTLNISLGRDRNIVIAREKNQEFSKRKTLGGNVVETRGFKISIRNKKSLPIKLSLFDQIPVPVISDISVTPLELSKGQIKDKTGKIVWELNLDPQQQKEINFQYEVKYPKKEKVILE